MSDKTLRQLARAYAQGKLDKQEYRQARTELIEGILTGDVTLRENDYPSPLRFGSSDDATERKAHKKRNGTDSAASVTSSVNQATESDVPASSSETKAWPIITGIAGLVLIPVVIYILLPSPSVESDDNQAVSEETANMETNVKNTVPEVDTSQARELIDTFLKERSWKQESINAFLSSWKNLPEKQRQAMRESVTLGRLNNAIYKQLLAEKALSGLDDGGTAMEKQKMLVDFARQMGIDDPRISMPENYTGSESSSADNNDEMNDG